MKIGYLGLGCWGYCLALLLANKGHLVKAWSQDLSVMDRLRSGCDHPFLPGHQPPPNLHLCEHPEEVLVDVDLVVESVTSKGIRPLFSQLASLLQALPKEVPIVLTSKGIEVSSGKILPEVAVELLGPTAAEQIGVISGPSFAKEVVRGLPTSVVAAANNPETAQRIVHAFTNHHFRVYPNSDLRGVCYGGALKNIIAIACGIAEGLALGDGARASLITRGLHEMRKLALASGCHPDTLYGLAGLGDLCLTCSSTMSRNCSFGMLLAHGRTTQEATQEIGTVVEGISTCEAAVNLSKERAISMPIAQTVHQIIHQSCSAAEAVTRLMQREIKDEMR